MIGRFDLAKNISKNHMPNKMIGQNYNIHMPSAIKKHFINFIILFNSYILLRHDTTELHIICKDILVSNVITSSHKTNIKANFFLLFFNLCPTELRENSVQLVPYLCFELCLQRR